MTAGSIIQQAVVLFLGMGNSVMSQIAPSYIQIFLFQSAAGFKAESSLY